MNVSGRKKLRESPDKPSLRGARTCGSSDDRTSGSSDDSDEKPRNTSDTDDKRSRKQNVRETVIQSDVNKKVKNLRNRRVAKDTFVTESLKTKHATETEVTPPLPSKSRRYVRGSLMCVGIAVLCICFGIIYALQPRKVALATPSRSVRLFKAVGTIIGALRNTKSDLNSVNRSLNFYVKVNRHERPEIVLLLETNSSSCVFCNNLVALVTALCQYYEEDKPTKTSGLISADEVHKKSKNEGKIYIEDSIERALRDQHKHVIIMRDIDKFPNSSLPKVHVYLDNENAPYKEVIYILTAKVGGYATEENSTARVKNYLRDLAESHFDEKWSEYKEEHRRALMGRMLSAIGLIHADSTRENDCSSGWNGVCKI